MIKNYMRFLGLIMLISYCTACTEDDSYVSVQTENISPVTLDLNSIPYKNLSEYNFFDGRMADLNPVEGVLPYKIISGLFIDYAKAQTFVWMPKGVQAKYVDDHSLFDFPEGTVLITTHYFENVLPKKETQMIETRLLIKKENEWVLVNYKWNDDQSEAVFTTDSHFVGVSIEENNQRRSVNYKIPSYDECFTCHNKYDEILPIGPKPQNINSNLAFKDGIKNQLQKWAEYGYLEKSYPENINTVVNWEDDSQDLSLRVRSYLDINCAHCHSEKGYCEYAPVRFEFNETKDMSNMGVDVVHTFGIDEALSHIVSPGNPDSSALFFRMSSTLDEFKMPIIGRSQQHEEGVELLKQWINTLEKNK